MVLFDLAAALWPSDRVQTRANCREKHETGRCWNTPSIEGASRCEAEAAASDDLSWPSTLAANEEFAIKTSDQEPHDVLEA